jgi:hypothetical protein
VRAGSRRRQLKSAGLWRSDLGENFVVNSLIKMNKHRIECAAPLEAFAVHHRFCVLKASFRRYDAPHEAEGGHPMTFIKPLNVVAVCAAFIFVGAIVFGIL